MFRELISFIRRDWYIEISYKFSFILQFIGIFFQIAVFYFFSRFIGHGADSLLKDYGGNYFAFVLVGIAYQSYFNLALGGFSQNLRRDQMLGTLEMMLVAPLSGSRILALSAAFNSIFTSFRIVFYLVIGMAFFHLELPNSDFFACALILLLTIFSFSGLGILSAAFIMLVKRGDPVVTFFTMLNSLLSGVYFTTDMLPPVLKNLSLLLPMTHSLHAFRRALLNGAGAGDLYHEIAMLMILGTLTIPLGLWTFRYAINQVKLRGSLGQY